MNTVSLNQSVGEAMDATRSFLEKHTNETLEKADQILEDTLNTYVGLTHVPYIGNYLFKAGETIKDAVKDTVKDAVNNTVDQVANTPIYRPQETMRAVRLPPESTIAETSFSTEVPGVIVTTPQAEPLIAETSFGTEVPGATPTTQQNINNVNDSMVDTEAESLSNKAVSEAGASGETDALIDSTAGDDNPIGLGITAALGIATLITDIVDGFEGTPTPPSIQGGSQIGA